MRKVICLCCAFVMAASVWAGAEEEKTAGIETSANLTYVSKYIWRGWDMAPKNEPAIQGGVTASAPSGVSLNVWGSYALDSDKHFDEIDYTLDYTKSLSPENDLSLGYIYYSFPGVAMPGARKTQEIYGGVSFPKVALKPVVTLFYDWDAGNGMYLQAKGETEFKISKDSSLPPVALNIAAGYNKGQWETPGASVNGISDIDLGLSMAFKSGLFTITPSINYVTVPAHNIPTDDGFWFGLNVSTDI